MAKAEVAKISTSLQVLKIDTKRTPERDPSPPIEKDLKDQGNILKKYKHASVSIGFHHGSEGEEDSWICSGCMLEENNEDYFQFLHLHYLLVPEYLDARPCPKCQHQVILVKNAMDCHDCAYLLNNIFGNKILPESEVRILQLRNLNPASEVPQILWRVIKHGDLPSPEMFFHFAFLDLFGQGHIPAPIVDLDYQDSLQNI